jgi:hypothetical protein
MTLKEYIEEQQLMLVAFEQYWGRANKDAPTHFPLELDAGEWDEQLKIFDAVIE